MGRRKPGSSWWREAKAQVVGRHQPFSARSPPPLSQEERLKYPVGGGSFPSKFLPFLPFLPFPL